jgi:anti-anti-sigma factor
MALFIDRDDEGVILVRGEIDLGTAGLLEETAIGAPADGKLVLDLRDVTFIDSTGIRALVRVARSREPTTIVLRDPSPRVEKLLRLVGLDGDAPWITEHTRLRGDGPGAWSRFAATVDHSRRAIREAHTSAGRLRHIRTRTLHRSRAVVTTTGWTIARTRSRISDARARVEETRLRLSRTAAKG